MIETEDEDRIVNGEESEPHSHPYMIALLFFQVFNCGATILSKNHQNK